MNYLENKKVLICCANGSGSSVMVKFTLQKMLDKLEIRPAALDHKAAIEGAAEAYMYDIIICPESLKHLFEAAKEQGVLVLGLKNVMSAPEMEKALRANNLID